MGGIYAVVHRPSKKRYIGSTVDFKSRKTQHFTDLRLQSAFDKYGEDQFTFEIIQNDVPESELLDVERVKILEYDTITSSKGYNLTAETKAPMRGRKMSAANKKKKSELFTGSRHPLSKINEMVVSLIFELNSVGLTQQEIADKVGVCQSNISLILRGKAWDHVGLSLDLPRCDNTSGCVGVYFVKNMNKWKAEIVRNGQYFGLGYFVSKEDAISARKNSEVSLGL